MERAAKSSVVPFFCDELVTKILLKLPPKARITCTCVCKRWQKLISHPSFIQALKSLPPISVGFFYYDDETKKDDPTVKYYCTSNNKFYPIVASSDSEDQVIPFLVSASHNGFLLCVDEDQDGENPAIFIYNPYTKQSFSLPPNPESFYVNQETYVLFTYEKQDSYDVEFKVIGIQRDFYSLYSSEIGKWTVSELHYHEDESYDFSESRKFVLAPDLVYLWDGNCRWNSFGVFDLKEESIRLLMLPDCDGIEYCYAKHILVYAETLYYLVIFGAAILIWAHDEGDKWSFEHNVSFVEYPIVLAFHPTQLALVIVSSDIPKNQSFIYHVDRSETEFVPDFHPSQNEMHVIPYLLPAWLPRLKESNNLNLRPGVWRSPCGIHEEKDFTKEEDVPNNNYEEELSSLFVPGTPAYNLNFPPLSEVIPKYMVSYFPPLA